MDICRKQKPPMMEIRPNHYGRLSSLHGGDLVSEEYLIEATNLKKYFPIRGGFFKKELGAVRAIDDVRFPNQARRDPRSGGGERMR